MFYLLKEIRLFTDNRVINIEQLHDEEWIAHVVLLMDMTGHWNDLSSDLHGKYKIFTDMYDNIDVFNVTLRM